MKPSTLPATQWHMPEYVHPLLHDGGMIYLNGKSGNWGQISRLNAAVLLAACDVLDELELGWRESERPEIHNSQMLEGFVKEELLAYGPGTHPSFSRVVLYKGIEHSAGSVITMTRRLAEPTLPKTDLERLATKGARLALTLINNKSFSELIVQVQKLRGPHAVPATLDETLNIAHAVRQVSDWLPGRFACLERTLAIVIVGAKKGLHIGLQFGASVDPITYHAWPTAQGQAATLPGESSITGHFWPVFEI